MDVWMGWIYIPCKVDIHFLELKGDTVVRKIMPCKDDHVLIPKSVNMLPYMTKGDFFAKRQMQLN